MTSAEISSNVINSVIDHSTRNDECEMCRSVIYLNPLMKLLLSNCGHYFCETCIKRHEVAGKPIVCPICKTSLSKERFTLKDDGEAEFEKEINIRRTIMKDFNKILSDFSSLKDYNDYLEEIEDIIYNLAHDIDIEETKDRIRRYVRDNRESIISNRARQAQREHEQQQNQEMFLMTKSGTSIDPNVSSSSGSPLDRNPIIPHNFGIVGQSSSVISSTQFSPQQMLPFSPIATVSQQNPTFFLASQSSHPLSYSYKPHQQAPSTPAIASLASSSTKQLPVQTTKTIVTDHLKSFPKNGKSSTYGTGWTEQYVIKRSIEEAFCGFTIN